MTQKIYKGIGSGSGFAIAPAIIVHRGELSIPRIELDESEVEPEILRFIDAIAITRKQLNRIRAAIAKAMGEDAATVIDAQLLVLSDPSLNDEIEKLIKKKRVNAEHALDTVMKVSLEALEETDSSFFRERIQDFNDVRRRLLANLMGLKHQVIPKPTEELILVINSLAPSETAHLFGSKFIGLITESGGFTSHIAIMTRTMDLPAVLGIDEITEIIPADATVIADSMRGQVVIEPEPEILEEYRIKQELYIRRRKFVMKAVKKPSITTDGTRITIAANMELPEEVPLAKHYGAEGIGLFRTELLYIQSEELPSEEKQFEIYRKIAQEVAPHSAIIRTFDIGGDKLGHIFAHHLEPNPFLGFRAIRIGLVYRDMFKVQLRAILRASHFGNLKIIFPMIALAEEMRTALQIIAEVKEELRDKKIPFDEKIEVGTMIEVPSAAILSRELAIDCDFFSIGTNDLIQYTLAADRGNPRVAHIYQSFHPAVLKLIKFTIDSAHLAGIWCGVCGEMAGETRAVPFLLGMGLDEFSTVPSRAPLVKTIIRSISKQDSQKIAEKILRFTTQDEVIEYLDEMLPKILPKELI